ncbi:hypothetical protein Ga0466249_005335, partial [Sporomusaceae bacterium BoRhaA]|uniref:DUF1351 domain-containing protein n=1 Tax=Pelorhabdus rhamnosifermentans TaxID=2772457 RepID=UPI001C05FCB4
MKNEVVLSSEIPPGSAEMEPKIIKDVHEFTWNFSDIKANLSGYISKYTGLVVTEDNLKDMEAAQKEIAGVRTKIDGFRKTVKKKLEEPYKQFESEIKELQALIEQAEKPLKEQIDKYEEARVVKLESELLTFAENTSNNLGLRPEYVGKFSIQSAWIKRTAKITTTR